MKRGRSDTLTGGTKDINPQFLTFTAAQSAADTTTTTQVPMPIQRLPQGNRSQVMEVLKVMFWNSTVVETDNSVQVYLSTTNFQTTAPSAQFGDAYVFAAWNRLLGITTSGQFIRDEPVVVDLTDGVGHGILIATDFIFATVASTGTSAAQTIRCKILYRMKNVGLQEYVGILASQSRAT